jgi:hypothetical protein
MNDMIRKHIAGIYLNSAIYCADSDDSKRFTKEMIFWAKPGFLNSAIKQVVANVFGYYFLVRLLRVFKEKVNFKLK